jgi:hypothetical protein
MAEAATAAASHRTLAAAEAADSAMVEGNAHVDAAQAAPVDSAAAASAASDSTLADALASIAAAEAADRAMVEGNPHVDAAQAARAYVAKRHAALAATYPPGALAAAQYNLRTICDILFNTDIKSIEYASAVLLISVLRSDPQYYLRYIQQRGDNFLEIMESEEQTAKETAYAASGAIVEDNIDSDIVISGRSPRAIQLGDDMNPSAAEEQIYTDLMRFISSTRRNIAILKQLMLKFNYTIQTTVMQGVERSRVYDNIDYVMTGPQEIFPKFSFNIICEKEPLLQTMLVAGRENGMGKILSTFVFIDLKNFFQGFPDAKLKIIEPSESNRLWQVKLSVHKNDFVFFSIQIINVKRDFFFDADTLAANFPIVAAPNQDGVRNPMADVRNRINQLFANLCFSLYNKASSRDFNCLCSLSELDTFMLRELLSLGGSYPELLQRIRFFLTHLVDTQINIKKKYFILGLYNLIYCSTQQNYTIETKVYRWLFDRPVPELNVVANQDNKNVFLYAMRIIQHVNLLCKQTQTPNEEESRVVMGGGKQYSLFQKALNKFFINNVGLFDSLMQRVVDELYPDDGTPERVVQRQKLDRELNHTIIKAAADADFGFFHKPGALGSTECMSACMLLQVALKKLIDYLVQPTYRTYTVDIGNSCIGNPPSTLSSLRMVLNDSLLFYNHLEGVTPEIADSIIALLGEIGINLDNIDSTISPFDIVPKGSMEEYIKHIIEAVLLFNGEQIPADLTNLYKVLSDYCMITIEGFSSPLKGIFDIFYTLFIIENFTNRTLVTQKINKELKRISICAQILYLHYSELYDHAVNTRNAAAAARDAAIAARDAAAAAPDAMVEGNPAAAADATIAARDAAAADATIAAHDAAHDAAAATIDSINPMLNILKDMIIYGYNGSNLLDPDQFRLIMQKYVDFMHKLIEFNRHPDDLRLNFCCVNTLPHNSRRLTTIEIFFMNLLENSNHEPPPPPPPAGAPPPPPADFADINEPQRNTLLASLGCIQPTISALREMDPDYLSRLCQNKIYSSYRDTKNKSNSIVVISIAYQSFLWDTQKQGLIKKGNMTDNEVRQDNQHFFVDGITHDPNRSAMGLSNIFIDRSIFFGGLLAALAPCYDPEQNLLDISTEQFDGIIINHPIQFQFMFWFITSVFGIKTKSAPKKIISLSRTYLNNIREIQLLNRGLLLNPRLLLNPILGCNITFPLIPNPNPAPIEVIQEEAGGAVRANPLPNDINFLYLAYDTYAITLAYSLYKKASANLGGPVADAAVFKIDNMVAIHKTSLVLRKDVISRLTDAFSKKPRGQVYVNQSSAFMNPILTNVITGIEGILQNSVIERTIGDILSLITRLAPNILRDNPYNPPGHDISKFMDFKTDPQSYRNKWIVYFVTEIFNSHDNGDNFFNHVVLLILLFRYLTLLPTDAIDSQQIIITSQTTPNCIADAKALIIKTYACRQILEIDVAHREGIDPDKLRDEVERATDDTHKKNREVDAAAAATAANAPAARDAAAVAAAAAADARADAAAVVVLATAPKNSKKTRAAAAQAAAAPIFPPLVAPAAAADPAAVAASVVRRRAAPAAAAAAAAMVDYAADAAAAAVPRKSVRGSRSGGTIRTHNPHSPKKTNNHTRKNKYKRNNKIKNKKHKSSPKYRKVNPSSRSGSKSNKKKSKSKLPHKNVTFKRRRYNNK